MKRILALIFTVTLAVVVSLVAWGAEQGEKEKIDQVVTDGLLGLKIKAGFLKELGWDAMSIDIEVDGDAVTLSGEVTEKKTKGLAKQVAKSFPEVRTVKNHITLEKPAEKDSETPVADAVGNAEEEVRDAVLETRVKTKLVTELGRHGFRVEVEAVDGVVSLRGKVPDEERRDVALEATKGCPGVEKVIDLLQVTPS